MQIGDLNILFGHHPEVKSLQRMVSGTQDRHVLVSGLRASARALALSALTQRLFIVMDNAEAAQYMYSDLRSLTDKIFFFPSSKRRRTTDDAALIQRTECLTALTSERAEERLIVVTYPEAVAEEVPEKERLSAVSFQLTVGQEIQQSELAAQLSDLGFERVDFVFQPGQYAVRGSIVDIYSYGHDIPFRLDFFGDEIESIREFDIEDQLSKNKVERADLVGPASPDRTQTANADRPASPDRAQTAGADRPASPVGPSIVDYLSADTVWVSNDWTLVSFKWDGLQFTGGALTDRRTIEMADKSTFVEHTKIAFDIMPQPVFHKQFDLLTDDLRKHIEEGYTIYILAEQQKQLDRLSAIFESVSEAAVSFTGINASLHEGFVDRGLKICCYTDHQIFERYHRVSMGSENARRGKAIITLREINQLQIGDYVVHSDHGIAKFGGLVTTPVNGKPQEMIKLNYRDGANVFVSIHNLHRISKYKGREGSEPTIARLGSGAWERLKERTKDKVKDIARDLIRLYATRKQQKGFAYSPDGYMQHELEASFLYEDTPDQAKATADVKRDLESPMPMDRLVCGDVGFGKTEVAMRAAFKVASDGKQVAVLVPTTVLALQH